jgi:hypothetical protein
VLAEAAAHVVVQEALAGELPALRHLRLGSVLPLESLLQDRGSGLQRRLRLFASADERSTADEASVELPIRNVARPQLGSDAELPATDRLYDDPSSSRRHPCER